MKAISGIFGGGGGGGGSAPAPEKPKPTKYELELGRQATQRFDRYMSRYAPLEEQMIDGVNRPVERLISGRSNADVMREASLSATGAIESGGITTGLTALDGINRALSRAGSDTAVAASVGDRAVRDERAMGAIEVGTGMARGQITGLAELGSIENQRALSRFDAENRMNLTRNAASAYRSQARLGATMGVLGTAAGAGLQVHQMNQQQQRINRMLSAPALNDWRDY